MPLGAYELTDDELLATPRKAKRGRPSTKTVQVKAKAAEERVKLQPGEPNPIQKDEKTGRFLAGTASANKKTKGISKKDLLKRKLKEASKEITQPDQISLHLMQAYLPEATAYIISIMLDESANSAHRLQAAFKIFDENQKQVQTTDDPIALLVEALRAPVEAQRAFEAANPIILVEAEVSEPIGVPTALQHLKPKGRSTKW